MEEIKKVTDKKVPAIEKADKIFDYLYKKDKATQATIAKNLDIPKATANRLLAVLTDLNYLSFEDRFYSLGEKFRIFSNKKDKHILIKNIAHPYLEELSIKFKETFKLSVLDENVVRCIAKIQSGDLVKISVSENAIFPLHAGAASKILISQLSESKLNKLLTPVLPRYTENTITDREELKKELFKVNINKIAYDNMEHSEQIKAVAVPILNENNKVIAAISCPYFPESLTPERKKILSKELKKVASEISKRLAYFK